MIEVVVNLEGDGSASDLAERGLEVVHLGNDAPPIRVAYLTRGMASGFPSVALLFELPGGKQYVMAEMSARLFVAAGRMVATKAYEEGFDL